MRKIDGLVKMEMEENLEEYGYVFKSKQFIPIIYNDIKIYQINDASFEYDSNVGYSKIEAQGIDEKGFLYTIQWDFYKEYQDEDGSLNDDGKEVELDMLCDWDNPSNLKNETLNFYL